jgi:hypothetical protein
MKAVDEGIHPERWSPWMLEHWLRCPNCAFVDRARPSDRTVQPVPALSAETVRTIEANVRRTSWVFLLR